MSGQGPIASPPPGPSAPAQKTASTAGIVIARNVPVTEVPPTLTATQTAVQIAAKVVEVNKATLEVTLTTAQGEIVVKTPAPPPEGTIVTVELAAGDPPETATLRLPPPDVKLPPAEAPPLPETSETPPPAVETVSQKPPPPPEVVIPAVLVVDENIYSPPIPPEIEPAAKNILESRLPPEIRKVVSAIADFLRLGELVGKEKSAEKTAAVEYSPQSPLPTGERIDAPAKEHQWVRGTEKTAHAIPSSQPSPLEVRGEGGIYDIPKPTPLFPTPLKLAETPIDILPPPVPVKIKIAVAIKTLVNKVAALAPPAQPAPAGDTGQKTKPPSLISHQAPLHALNLGEAVSAQIHARLAQTHLQNAAQPAIIPPVQIKPAIAAPTTPQKGPLSAHTPVPPIKISTLIPALLNENGTGAETTSSEFKPAAIIPSLPQQEPETGSFFTKALPPINEKPATLKILQVKILAVLPEHPTKKQIHEALSSLNSPLSEQKQIDVARVAGKTPAGQILLETPKGHVVLQTTKYALPTGAIVITESTPASDALAAVATPDGKPPLSFSLLSEGDFSGIQLPDFHPLTSRSWPALEEALRAAAPHTLPEAAALRDTLPAPTPKLPATALFFLAALKSGAIENWLGEKGLELLKDAGHAKLVEKLGQDFGRIATQAGETLIGDWKAISMPLLHDDHLSKLMFFVRHQTDEGGGGHEGGQKRTRFVLNLTLSRIGDMQIDGFFQPGKLDVVLRTHNALPQSMQREITGRYANALEQTRLAGQILFQTKGWLVLPEEDRAVKARGVVA